jgi:hypothetical protein
MPNLGFVNAELIVQEGGLAPLVELLSSSNEVRGPKTYYSGLGMYPACIKARESMRSAHKIRLWTV